MKKIALTLGLCLMSLPLLAADRACSAGKGHADKEVSGFRVSIAPATAAEHQGQCRAAVLSSEGAAIFEAHGDEAAMDQIGRAHV